MYVSAPYEGLLNNFSSLFGNGSKKKFVGCSILGGSLIVENVFSIPGVGSIYISAIGSKDYNVFLFVSLFYVFIGLLSAIIVDISYGFIDPRIRVGGRK